MFSKFRLSKNSIDKWLGLAALLAVCLWPLFFIQHGIDELDSAYYLSNFRYFFKPNMAPTISTELSFLLGGILYKFSPTATFFTFRVLDWLCNCAIFVLLYQMLKKHMPHTWLCFSMLVGSFLIRRYPMILGYNSFAFLFFILAIFLLHKGILQQSIRYTFVAGIVTGFNVFTRLPNALQASLVFLPLLYALANKDFQKQALRHSLYFTLAGFIGLFAGIGLTIALEGWQAFVEGIAIILHIGKQGSHAPSSMLNRIWFELSEAYYYVGFLKKQMLAAFLLPVAYAVFTYFVKHRYTKVLAQVAVLLVGVYLARLLGNNLTVNIYVYLLSFIALLTTLIAIPLFIKRNSFLFLYACTMLLFMFCVPLGTDNGIFQFCLLGAVLSSAVALYAHGFAQLGKKRFVQHLCKSMASILLLVFILSFGKGAYSKVLFQESYNDGAYAGQTYSTQIPALKYMKTHAYKAEALDSLYSQLTKEEYKNHKLAVLGHLPLALCITEHEPFFAHTWVDLKVVDKQAQLQQLQNTEKLPIVLIGHFLNSPMDKQPFIDFVQSKGYETIKHQHYTLYLPPLP